MTNGPYETKAEAHAGAAPLLAAIQQVDHPGGTMTDDVQAARRAAHVRYLTQALAAAGVKTGAFDRRIGTRLGETWEPESLAVIVGWLERAHADGCAEAALNVAPSEPKSTGAAPATLEAEFPDSEG